jgi:autotransporter translocation and assembly factor TamB
MKNTFAAVLFVAVFTLFSLLAVPARAQQQLFGTATTVGGAVTTTNATAATNSQVTTIKPITLTLTFTNVTEVFNGNVLLSLDNTNSISIGTITIGPFTNAPVTISTNIAQYYTNILNYIKLAASVTPGTTNYIGVMSLYNPLNQ